MTECYPLRNDAGENVAWREQDDEVLVIVGDKLQLLSPTAASVWKLCDGRHSTSDIIGAILEEYDVDSEVCRADTMACLEKLKTCGALLYLDTKKPT